MRLASLTAAMLLVSLPPLAFSQQPGPQNQNGQAAQGVGQGLAAPPGAANQGGRGQGQQQGGGRGAGGGGRGNAAAAGPAEPTPRWPNGKPRLGALPGGKGLWN